MAVARRLKEFLDENKVKYEVRTHPVVYTAQELAAVEHIPGKALAKVVIVKLDEEYAMAVLPAPSRVSMEHLKKAARKADARLASESEFQGLFPQCELGAMPPFGNLYGLTVYADPVLEEDEEITFPAGSHYETITLKYAEFKRLVQPQMVSFAVQQ